MSTTKLQSTDAFVVIDLDHDGPAMGVVRMAPKVLVDGASWLARSQTYQFASFDLKVSGASAGINAAAANRAEAVAAFTAEIAPMVASRRFLPDPGKGVGAEDLATLRAADARSELYWDHGREMRALGLAVSADRLDGGLDGRTVAIEGFEHGSATLVRALEQRGGVVRAVSTSVGSLCSAGALTADALEAGWDAHGADLVAHLGGEVTAASAVLGAEVDVLFAGSKAGVVDHTAAAALQASAVVPSGAIPVTAKALAVLRRSGTVVLPDFITTAGAMFAAFAPEGRSAQDVSNAVDRRISDALGEVIDHPDGPVVAACRRAESFLGTWCDTLPFGRPLA